MKISGEVSPTVTIVMENNSDRTVSTEIIFAGEEN